ncbi:N-6 DNA methylase [Aliikangiella coralliicola]|nr:N-6 DNA methylase [Aliikangiella coralliicola]
MTESAKFNIARQRIYPLLDKCFDDLSECVSEEDCCGLLLTVLCVSFLSTEKTSYIRQLYRRRKQKGNGKRIERCLTQLTATNPSLFIDLEINVFEVFQFNSEKLGNISQRDQLLKKLIENFSRIETEVNKNRSRYVDIFSHAANYVIGKTIEKNPKHIGQFVTPREISSLLAQLLAARPGESICDPTCGYGLTLTHFISADNSQLGDRAFDLYGQEINKKTWAIAKLNLLLHGSSEHQIKLGDTIRNPRLLDEESHLQCFDIVVADPPSNLENWGAEMAENDKYNRFSRGLPPKLRGDFSFVLHMLKTLKKDTGRMAIIVPHGVLFRGATEENIRQKLVDENLLEAIIGLPEKLFYGSNASVAILIFRKKKNHADGLTKNILFIDFSRRFEVANGRRKLGKKNVNQIIDTYHKHIRSDFSKTNTEKKIKDSVRINRVKEAEIEYSVKSTFMYVASVEEVRQNGYNLNIPQYIDTSREKLEIDLDAVMKDRKKLKKRLSEIESEIAKGFTELGYG